MANSATTAHALSDAARALLMKIHVRPRFDVIASHTKPAELRADERELLDAGFAYLHKATKGRALEWVLTQSGRKAALDHQVHVQKMRGLRR